MVLRLVLLRSLVSSRSVGRLSQVAVFSKSRVFSQMLGNLLHCHTAADLPTPPPLPLLDNAHYFAMAKDARPFLQEKDAPYYEDRVICSAIFAVNVHNQKQNAQLQFVRVLKADHIRGIEMLVFITLEVNDAGKSDFYRTVVCFVPWEKNREVCAWERVEAPLSPSADLAPPPPPPPPPPPLDNAHYFARAKHARPFTEEKYGPYYKDRVIRNANFAVNVHNQIQNAQLQFVRVLKADFIRVAGKLMFITLEVNDGGKSDFYRTVVYYRPWENKRVVCAWERVEAPLSPSPIE